MGSHQVKKLLHSKGNNQQSEETTHTLAENITNYPSDKGLITRIYKKLKDLCRKEYNRLGTVAHAYNLSALWETKTGGSLEVRNSRPAWPTW